MPSDSISEGLIFQNFLGGHAPRPPWVWHALHARLCFAHNHHAHSNKIVPPPPPFQNPGSAPVKVILLQPYFYCLYSCLDTSHQVTQYLHNVKKSLSANCYSKKADGVSPDPFPVNLI